MLAAVSGKNKVPPVESGKSGRAGRRGVLCVGGDKQYISPRRRDMTRVQLLKKYWVYGNTERDDEQKEPPSRGLSDWERQAGETPGG